MNRSHPSVLWLLVALVGVAGLLGSGAEVDALGAESEEGKSSGVDALEVYGVSDLLTDFTQLHPDVVATVSVDLASMGPVAVDLAEQRLRETDSDLRLRVATARQSILGGKIVATLEELNGALSEQLVARTNEAQAQQDLTEMAVSTFIAVEEAALERAGSGLEGNSLETVAADSQRRLTLGLEEAVGVREAAEAVVVEVQAGLDQLQSDLVEQEAAAEVAAAELVVAQEQIQDLQPRFERVLMTTRLTGTDIPVVVFDAYYRAELQIAEEQPACVVRWDQLAGIGKVESSHGSYGGNTVGVSGRTDGEILGPVLDGLVFSAITDTDAGRLDGDLEWDRAVGPMQFIPGSWSIYGRDGNGDGVNDPHNIYDAALAAGDHLCGTTARLDQDPNFQHALLGYNQSPPYGVLVMRLADDYLDLIGPIVVAPTGFPEGAAEPEFN